MSIIAWLDLNEGGTIFNRHKECLISNCKGQKQIIFTPKQFQLECGNFESELGKLSRGTPEKLGYFFEPDSKIATHLFSAAVGAKTKNSKLALTTNTFSKTISGGKLLSSTDMYGQGLHYIVM